MQRVPFLQELKQRTAASHEALEQLPLSARILSEGVTVADYRQYLERIYGFLQPFERLVFPLLQRVITDLDKRRKIPALEMDLAGLSSTPTRLPLFDETALQQTYQALGSAIGGLYVMEGSSLGGVVIAKHLNEKLGHEAGGNTRYFNFYGTATGTAWKTFIGNLVAVADNGVDQEAIIAGAEITFRQLKQWMDVPVISTTRGSWGITA